MPVMKSPATKARISPWDQQEEMSLHAKNPFVGRAEFWMAAAVVAVSSSLMLKAPRAPAR